MFTSYSIPKIGSLRIIVKNKIMKLIEIEMIG